MMLKRYKLNKLFAKPDNNVPNINKIADTFTHKFAPNFSIVFLAISSTEISTDSFMGVPLYVICCSPPAAVNILFNFCHFLKFLCSLKL